MLDEAYCWDYTNREIDSDKPDKYMFDETYYWDCASKEVDLNKSNEYMLIFFEYSYSFVYT